jgi:prepilin-type N-terminal cleavage/methylation domain-containing protein
VRTRDHPNRRRSRGLSLVETLVAIAVFAIIVGLTLSAFWYAIKTVRSFQQ